jgi:hypothetical protein
MVSTALSVYFLVHCTLLAWTFSFGGPTSARLWFLRVMLLGMAYDNLVLMLGNLGVGSNWYLIANYPRFLLHAAVLPFLTLFALSAMRVCELPLAARAGFRRFCWLFTFVALGYGLWHEVWLLGLEPTEVMGHLRLVSVSDQPPYATIATNLLILPMALGLWRRAHWPVFFLAALFILVVNGGSGGQPWGFLAGNGAEVIFICCLLITERFLLRRLGYTP